MLTGTPLDLTPFGPLLSVLGFAYWLLAFGLIVLSLRRPKRWPVKLAMAGLVVAVFAAPALRNLKGRHDAQGRIDEAMALFAERCKTAGEKINRTVNDVDGVVWLKWREKISNADNFADQWKLNDPYGQDCGATDCISNLLRVTKGQDLDPEEAQRHVVGYRFVETKDPSDGRPYRYTAAIGVTHQRTADQLEQYKKNTGKDPGLDVIGYVLDRKPIERFGTRYGVIWDDISTREDRAHWIAGGSLKVIDLQTNEVLAQRVGYMIDRGQGSQAGGRSPWAYARDSACPVFRASSDGRAYFDPVSAQFTQRVLRARNNKE